MSALVVLFVSGVAAIGQTAGPSVTNKPAANPNPPAQPKAASLYISADGVYSWTLDGKLQGITSADMGPRIVPIAKLGEHEIVISSQDGKIELNQIVTVKAGQQTVVRFTATAIVISVGAVDMQPVSPEEAAKRMQEVQRQIMLKNPSFFGSLSFQRATKGGPTDPANKWVVSIGVASRGRYESKLQLSSQDASGKWRQLPDAQPGGTTGLYQVFADSLGTQIAVCYTAKSDVFPNAKRETAWFNVKPAAAFYGTQQMMFEEAKPATLEDASDAPCGGKNVAAADPSAPAAASPAQAMAESPKRFGRIDTSVMRYKNQWNVNIQAGPGRLGTTYYDEEVQFTLKGVAGHSEPVHVTNLQPSYVHGTYQTKLAEIGTEAVVCYTAKNSVHPTPMRMTVWYKVTAGDTAANFAPSREPTLVPASSAPCE
jgi:hypothetical protein